MRTWLILLATLCLTACDDGETPVDPVDTLPTADATPDTGPEADMAAVEPDMATAEPDMAAVEPDMAAVEPDMAAVDPDMAIDLDMAAPDPDMAPPEPDAMPLPDAFFRRDAQVDPDPDAGEEPDARPGFEGICEPCDDVADCQGVGGEAQCADLIGGRGCLPGCGDNDDCDEGFFCLESRCTPGGARCDSCVVVGCDGDDRCNQFTGECQARTGQCGNCREDADCDDGLACRPLGFARNCLVDCEGGAECPEGFECTEGTCTPAAGFCDPCGGSCVGDRPVCDFIARECVQCAAGTPCPEGEICDEGSCVEPPPGVECNSGLDCRDEALPFCEEQRCVACRADADCDIGQACVEGACAEADLCARVTCNPGAECADGVCVGENGDPACRVDADCEGDLLCNGDTGQCYAANQQCDPDGNTSVCHPGGDCVPNPLNANENVCTCARRDPGNFQEPNEEHRIPCQPGGTCIQLGPDPGACVSFGG